MEIQLTESEVERLTWNWGSFTDDYLNVVKDIISERISAAKES